MLNTDLEVASHSSTVRHHANQVTTYGQCCLQGEKPTQDCNDQNMDDSRTRISTQRKPQAFWVPSMTSSPNQSLDAQAVTDLPCGVSDFSSKFHSLAYTQEHVPYTVNISNVSKPNHTKRQDSGYFDMPMEQNFDSERAEDVFVVENKNGNPSSEVQGAGIEEEQKGAGIEQEQRYLTTCKDMGSSDGLGQGLRDEDMEHGSHFDMPRAVLEDFNFYVSNDVSLEESPKGNADPLLPQCNEEVLYGVPDEVSSNTATCDVSRCKYPQQFLNLLSSLPDIVSRFQSRFTSIETGNAGKPSGTDEATSTFDTYEHLSGVSKNEAKKFEDTAGKRLEKHSSEESEDIQLEVSQLWFIVKALSLAVFLLTVAVVILFYKVHNLQCPEMMRDDHTRILDESYPDEWKNEHPPPHKTSEEKGPMEMSDLPKLQEPPLSFPQDHGSNQPDLRTFDPERDDLLWLDNDVHGLQGSILKPRDFLHGQDGTAKQLGESKSQLGRAQPPSQLTAMFQTFHHSDDDDDDEISDDVEDIEESDNDDDDDDDVDVDDMVGNDEDDSGGDDDDETGGHGDLGDKVSASGVLAGSSGGQDDSIGDLKTSPRIGLTRFAKSSNKESQFDALVRRFTSFQNGNPLEGLLSRKVRSADAAPTDKPKGKSKKRGKWRGKKRNKNKKWNGKKSWEKCAVKTVAQRSGGTGSIPGRVKPRTLKLVLVADKPGVWHYGFSCKSGRPSARITLRTSQCGSTLSIVPSAVSDIIL
ncbi:replicase polyprotein 1a [Elysia marginata]|uniref:Replicase polyprotein 1a n=1 Tax=Elysia marginata TaxID=1093978 RepID=A0AAV4J8C0_9GAST|nr:replicase polyprotein 1a [Elysia marginata]